MGADDRVDSAAAMEDKSPITHSQFLVWKRQKDADAAERRAEVARKREEDIRAGIVQMNGRELFAHEPWVFDNNLY